MCNSHEIVLLGSPCSSLDWDYQQVNFKYTQNIREFQLTTYHTYI